LSFQYASAAFADDIFDLINAWILKSWVLSSFLLRKTFGILFIRSLR